MSLTIISGSPCEPCAGWRGADIITPNPANIGYNFAFRFEYDACACGPPSWCYPGYQDRTASGGPNNYWFGPFIEPASSGGGATAHFDFLYNGSPVAGMNGQTNFVGSRINVPLPVSALPAQWGGTKADIGVAHGTPGQPNYYIEYFTFYTTWDLPFAAIKEFKAFGPYHGQLYGFAYTGSLVSGKRQVASYQGTVTKGEISPWPQPGSIYFNGYPSA